jgi:hypothetical protein
MEKAVVIQPGIMVTAGLKQKPALPYHPLRILPFSETLTVEKGY